MILVKKSATANKGNGELPSATIDDLLDSTYDHIDDVTCALEFICDRIMDASEHHDDDKISDIEAFYSDFSSGFKKTDWWDKHKKINRHHLLNHVPPDVNLIDVLEMIADCVVSGMARNGSVYDIKIPASVLNAAVKNTVELLKANIEMKE